MLVKAFDAGYQANLLLAAGGEGGSPFDFSTDLAIWTLVIFLGTLYILGRYAWGPIVEGLDKREQRIADDIEGAEKTKQLAEAELKQYQEKLAVAEAEAAAIIAEARKDAAAVRELKLAEATEEAQRIRDRAMSEIQAAKDAVVRELAESSVDSAVTLAGSIVGRSLSKDDHADLIQKSLGQFKTGV